MWAPLINHNSNPIDYNSLPELGGKEQTYLRKDECGILWSVEYRGFRHLVFYKTHGGSNGK